jgi:hypothetical protein
MSDTPADGGTADLVSHFCNPQAVAAYADGPRRFVPGPGCCWPNGCRPMPGSWFWAPGAGWS